jgi:hypothetical protein
MIKSRRFNVKKQCPLFQLGGGLRVAGQSEPSIEGKNHYPFEESNLDLLTSSLIALLTEMFPKMYLLNLMFLWPCIIVENYFNNQLNAQFLYSLSICMLHYNPRHVSSINMPIFRRRNFIITASGVVTLCKRLYRIPDESRLLCSLLLCGILYCTIQRVTIPDAVIIQFVLLKMGILMLETCRGL